MTVMSAAAAAAASVIATHAAMRMHTSETATAPLGGDRGVTMPMSTSCMRWVGETQSVMIMNSLICAVGAASSRSHAVCRIYIYHHPRHAAPPPGAGWQQQQQQQQEEEGCLTLVDLAGSEHKIDSMYHDAQRRKEGAQINSSLMASQAFPSWNRFMLTEIYRCHASSDHEFHRR
jgi:hypothetical protein